MWIGGRSFSPQTFRLEPIALFIDFGLVHATTAARLGEVAQILGQLQHAQMLSCNLRIGLHCLLLPNSLSNHLDVNHED